RVALARALITRPAVVFADEPTGNLDSHSTEILLHMFRRAGQEIGQTIVLVTHDPLAASYADRILFLSDGQIMHETGKLSAADVIETVASVRCAARMLTFALRSLLARRRRAPLTGRPGLLAVAVVWATFVLPD